MIFLYSQFYNYNLFGSIDFVIIQLVSRSLLKIVYLNIILMIQIKFGVEI